LFCDATGKPTPNVTWTRVLKNGTDGDVVFFGNPWVIVNISRTATGTYRCTAYNGIGNPVNHSLYVNVTCKYKHALHIGEINNYYVRSLYAVSFQVMIRFVFLALCEKKRKTQSIDLYSKIFIQDLA